MNPLSPLNLLRKIRHKFRHRNFAQLANSTWHNRYPEIFQYAQDAVATREPLKILSYGCSTGEECHTLREYFPNAEIVGVDIEVLNLDKARATNEDPKIRFLESKVSTIKEEGSYDLIFAMSVLCRFWTNDPDADISKAYPFTNFEKSARILSEQIKDGGALVIFNSSYRFSDSTASNSFIPLPTPNAENRTVPIYTPANQRIAEGYEECIFQKELPSSGNLRH